LWSEEVATVRRASPAPSPWTTPRRPLRAWPLRAWWPVDRLSAGVVVSLLWRLPVRIALVFVSHVACFSIP
jgi:hypothetical protein